MTLSVWISLLVAGIAISLTPGAGAINTMSNSMREGWLRSIWGILGQQLGMIAHIVIVAAGVGLIVSRSPILFNVVRYAGAAYLVYLGVRLILIKTDAAEQPEESSARTHEPAWSLVRRGFWVNFLNPKSIVFFLAFLPQFIRMDRPALPQYLIFTATIVIVDIILMWGVFAGAARPFRRLTSTPRGRRTINCVFGALFIVVAGLLLLMH